MNQSPHPSAAGYGLALAALAGALLLRWLLDPVLGDTLPLVTLFAAVAAAVWFGGYRPALLVVVLGYLACAYLFIEPRGHHGLDEARNLVGLFAYLLTCFIIVALGEAMRLAQFLYRDGQDAARQQAELLRTTLASIGDGVIATDTGGLVTNMNAAAESLTGWAIADARGQPLDAVFRIVNETTRQPVANPATRAFEEGAIVGLANHTVLIRKDGQERPIDDSAALIKCERGEIVGCVLVFRDISERRRSEKEKQEAERQIATTLESISDGFMRFDRDWRIVYVNAEGERLSQRHRGELLGRPHWELFPATAGTKLEAEYRRAVAESVTVEIENYYEPWGRWFAIKGYPSPDGGLAIYFRDVTDHKQAEDAVRRAEDQLRTITDTVPALIAYADADCRYRLNNRAYELWFGHSRSEITGRHMRDVLGDAAWSVVGPKVEAALAGQTVHYEAQVAYKDAGHRWVDATYVPSHGAGGEVVGVVVLVNDISERKEAEEKLRLANERFELAARATRDGIWDYDPATQENTWSPRCFELLGLPAPAEPQRISQTWLNERMHPDDYAPMWAAAEAYWSGRASQYVAEMRLRHEDGSWRWFLSRGVAVQDDQGRVVRMTGALSDDHDRRVAERELRESEERFRTVVAATSEILWTNDADGNMVGPQPGWGGFTGQSFEDYQGYGWSAAVHPDDAQPTIDEWERAVAERRRFEFEHRVRRRDGTYRLCSIRAVPILDGSGSVREWVGVHTDITEQRGLEWELKEADRRKDEFLATLAHELRNPLAPIRNGLQIMRLSGGSGPAVEQARTMMERQLGQMVHLVDDLLDLSRISRGKLELRKDRVALTAVLNNAVETSRPLIEASGHELTVVAPREPVLVDADVTRLGQVFANLLNNAAKYSERGGRIRLAAERQGREVVVSVTDTGVGIPPDMLPKIFEMFTQVDRSLEKSQGGLGIGLTLVKRLVEMHGGSVEARSEGQGRGSELVVRLPTVLSAVREVKPPTDEGEPACPSGQCRILVADDNRDSADSLAMMLEIMGNEVRTANDGLQAVDAAAAFRPDVILLDIGMPKLNGYETCRRIREQPGGGKIVLIALTGWGQDEDKRRSEEAGFNHHLVKPVDPVALENLLASLSAVGNAS